jgi:hypothetical protein
MRLKRINSIADLESLRDAILRQRDAFTKNIRICNTGCRARKSLKVSAALSQEITAQGLADKVAIKDILRLNNQDRAKLTKAVAAGLFYSYLIC